MIMGIFWFLRFNSKTCCYQNETKTFFLWKPLIEDGIITFIWVIICVLILCCNIKLKNFLRFPYPDPGSRIPEPGSKNPDPGTWIPEPGSWNPDPRSQNPDPGSWTPGLGSWNADSRTCYAGPHQQQKAGLHHLWRSDEGLLRTAQEAAQWREDGVRVVNQRPDPLQTLRLRPRQKGWQCLPPVWKLFHMIIHLVFLFNHYEFFRSFFINSLLTTRFIFLCV